MCQVVRLYNVVMSGDVVCCSVVWPSGECVSIRVLRMCSRHL